MQTILILILSCLWTVTGQPTGVTGGQTKQMASCWTSSDTKDVRIVTTDSKTTFAAQLIPFGKFLAVNNDQLQSVSPAEYTSKFTMISKVGGKYRTYYILL